MVPHVSNNYITQGSGIQSQFLQGTWNFPLNPAASVIIKKQPALRPAVVFAIVASEMLNRVQNDLFDNR